jgi:hypothetical protein
MNSLKTGVVVVVALFSFVCLFCGVAIAENKVAPAEEITGKEIQDKETEKQTAVKKKRSGKKEKGAITGSIEKQQSLIIGIILVIGQFPRKSRWKIDPNSFVQGRPNIVVYTLLTGCTESFQAISDLFSAGSRFRCIASIESKSAAIYYNVNIFRKPLN